MISVVDLTTLGANRAKCMEIEKYLQVTRNVCETHMKDKIGTQSARTFMDLFEEGVARLATSKSATQVFKHKAKGKYEVEKMYALRAGWLAHLQRSSTPLADMASHLGLEVDGGGEDAAFEADVEVHKLNPMY